MMWLWTGEVTAQEQGYRVLGTGAEGEMRAPEDIARSLPSPVLLRLFGMNANGKVYELTKALQVVK
jgi:hypothetical protein